MWVNWGIVKKDYQLLVAVLLFLFFRFKVQPQLRGRFLHTFDDGRILRQRIGLVVRCRELHLYLQVIILQRIDKTGEQLAVVLNRYTATDCYLLIGLCGRCRCWLRARSCRRPGRRCWFWPRLWCWLPTSRFRHHRRIQQPVAIFLRIQERDSFVMIDTSIRPGIPSISC